MKSKQTVFLMVLSLSIFAPLLVFILLIPQPAIGASIESFAEPFWAVLDNLMTNYWPASDNGDWMNDEAGYDAPQYSTELLYPLAQDTGDPLYTHRADRTVEYVIGMANIWELLQKIHNGEDITEEGASFPALLYGYRYYAGSNPYAFQRELPLLCFLAGQLMKKGVPVTPLMNGYSGPAVVAYYDLILAYALRDHGFPGRAALLTRQAYDLLQLAEPYWVQVTEDSGYYYDAANSNNLWYWALVLQAMTLAYQASGKDFYLDRTLDMLNYLEDAWDPLPPYGYRSAPGRDDKVLSCNHLTAKALLILYNATKDIRWFERAYQVISFMTDPILLIEDELFPGYRIIAHDWDPYYGTAAWWCTGCNFAVLTTIYMYNRLEQEGPSGVDQLPTCFIATAALGTGMDGKTKLLKQFRDTYLARSALGQAFVTAYYKYSPPVATNECIIGIN
jgi:hypothetical protein